MSLYHEAATVLTKSQAESVSVRTVVFAKKDWKTAPKQLLALASEAGKWSAILSEVVEKSALLKVERQLTPVLALVLVHDLLLSKRGVALPLSHGLNACIQRNKARLTAELTKARLRRGCSSLDVLRAKLEDSQAQDDAARGIRHPRWLRINLILTSKAEQMITTFADYRAVDSIEDVLDAAGEKVLYHDLHIPNLIAIPSTVDLTKSKAYQQGHIIFQDKASCFPAYLIDPQSGDGDIIDACAAPGNKTTHLAAILHESRQLTPSEDGQQIIACEKDVMRSKTLSKMVTVAGGDALIQIRPQQNFLKLDPHDVHYTNVSKLLLDPSCSGSGIVQRDQHMIKIELPAPGGEAPNGTKSKRRKRTPVITEVVEEQEETIQESDVNRLNERLDNLADFQLRTVLHAMEFPAARQISYSTCSIHAKENEEVVIKALLSDIAVQRGWTMQKRAQQVPGIQAWHIRGDRSSTEACLQRLDTHNRLDAETITQGCVRCDKRGEDGTMGFFVAGFVRDFTRQDRSAASTAGEDGDWSGFDDV